MAYPRRRRSVNADDNELAPPRPQFLASHRSSNSSFDSSLDTASDSDKDSPPEAPPQPRHAPRSRPKRFSVGYSPVAPTTPTSASWDPVSLYDRDPSPTPPQRAPGARPPPSAFAFPFQAYAGNPDPGLPVPGSRRRASLDSFNSPPEITHDRQPTYPPLGLRESGSLSDLRKPSAPFMGDPSGSSGSLPRSSSSTSLYKQSAAANMMPAVPVAGAEQSTPIPRNNSTHSFRAPFLAPTSRPSSSLWSPPNYANQFTTVPLPMSPSASTTALGASPYATIVSKTKAPLPSTRLAAPLNKEDKPWLKKRDREGCCSYLITIFLIILGLGAAAFICFQGWNSVDLLDEKRLCMVLNEQFAGDSLDENTWNRDVQLGGFGNGEFQMTTQHSDNLFIQNGQLYIHPTFTSDKIADIFNGGTYTLDGCTTDNETACVAVGNAASGSVINPVQSARINTRGKKSIRFGKVEVKAKLPRGDWLWPAIWMLPEDNVYGGWPLSGEIDILEARGNSPSYPGQGVNFVRSSLNYGPLPSVFHQIYGWWSQKRSTYADGFHTYTLEWDPRFMRVYVDNRIHAMLDLKIGKGRKKSFWDKAGFPLTAQNGSTQVVVENPWDTKIELSDGRGRPTYAAPYDQKFYLIVNLAVGGTSGWFPDEVGGKMWYDGSASAMRDFARAQGEWGRTWRGREERSFRIDSVKMWERC